MSRRVILSSHLCSFCTCLLFGWWVDSHSRLLITGSDCSRKYTFKPMGCEEFRSSSTETDQTKYGLDKGKGWKRVRWYPEQLVYSSCREEERKQETFHPHLARLAVMAITRNDISPPKRFNPVNQSTPARKSSITHDGPSLMSDLFTPFSCSDDRVHCYLPYKDDPSLLSSVSEMIKKIEQQLPSQRIHHIQITLPLYGPGVSCGDRFSKSNGASPSSSCVKRKQSEESSQEEDDDDEWVDIPTDEEETESEEIHKPSTRQAEPAGPRHVSVARTETKKTPVLMDKNHEKAPPTRNKICPECGKAFRTPSALKIHLLSHSDERPFKCSICEKAFKQTAGLLVPRLENIPVYSRHFLFYRAREVDMEAFSAVLPRKNEGIFSGMSISWWNIMLSCQFSLIRFHRTTCNPSSSLADDETTTVHRAHLFLPSIISMTPLVPLHCCCWCCSTHHSPLQCVLHFLSFRWFHCFLLASLATCVNL